jgi:pimeloyl-ACP methyl ester carboxylesterase
VRTIKNLLGVFVGVALLTSCSSSKQTAVVENGSSCSQLTVYQSQDNSVVVKSANIVPAGPVPAVPYQAPYAGTLASYCRVDGVIDERIGEGGKPYAIGFAIAMPEKWNGRFMMQGGGGLNGSVATPLGSSAAGDMTALQRGFAVVTTDTGHQGTHGFDASFFSDQEATLNFLYQAIGKVAITSKQIVAQYYGKSIEHSYFMGCSTGGREAMIMSQRYPRLFDGIVAGAPAMRTSFSNLADKWVMTSLAKIAPKDTQGYPNLAQALSAQDKKVVMDGLLKQCDALDGVADNMISNVVGCKFDPLSVACSATNKDACISPEKAKAIKVGFVGPKNSLGVQVYPGFWFDTGITETQGIPGLLNPGNHPIVGKITSTDMNVDQEAMAASTPAAFVGDSAYWTLLNTFSNNGGKLMFYHGVSDPWFSAQETARYYDQLVNDNGGEEHVSQWSRLFLIPGMGHCGGGSAALDQFDLIDPIVSWVERNQAPEKIQVTGQAFPNRSRPLCSYPSYAHYTGKGDSEKAENFECKSPE